MEQQGPAAPLHPGQQRRSAEPEQRVQQRQGVDLIGQRPEQGDTRTLAPRQRAQRMPRHGPAGGSTPSRIEGLAPCPQLRAQAALAFGEFEVLAGSHQASEIEIAVAAEAVSSWSSLGPATQVGAM